MVSVAVNVFLGSVNSLCSRNLKAVRLLSWRLSVLYPMRTAPIRADSELSMTTSLSSKLNSLPTEFRSSTVSRYFPSMAGKLSWMTMPLAATMALSSRGK